MTTPKKKTIVRKSKGKQHPVHAESLDRIADDLSKIRPPTTLYEADENLAKVIVAFRREANYLRSIVR